MIKNRKIIEPFSKVPPDGPLPRITKLDMVILEIFKERTLIF